MRCHLPSSLDRFRVRLSAFDAIWAAATPLFALGLRDAQVLAHPRKTIIYWAISLAFALIAFMVCRISDSIHRYFSVDDAINVMKAAVGANVMSGLVLFSLTRLDGIPRSVPLIQTLILAFGLLTVRGLHLWRDVNKEGLQDNEPAPEHIIMVGATRLTSLYIKFLEAYRPHKYRVIAILDDQPLSGRTMLGIPVIGMSAKIEHIVREFELHGLKTDRIVVGGADTLIPQRYRDDIKRLCIRREIMLQYVPDLIGLDKMQPAQPANSNTAAPDSSDEATVPVRTVPVITYNNLPRYHRIKRLLDFLTSTAGILIFSPLFFVVGLLVLVDVGTPLLFWQQRLGRGGRTFLVYKFRTYRAPIDGRGQPIPESERLSFIGKLMRRNRLDELPQLFSVLVGDMSLIGPRPLLPHDQPSDSSIRLSIRPGITGWAQVNGGNLITPQEKGALDDWYVRNASFWVDLHIVWLTLRLLIKGEQRAEKAISQALAAQQGSGQMRAQWPAASPVGFVNGEALSERLVAAAGSNARASYSGGDQVEVYGRTDFPAE